MLTSRVATSAAETFVALGAARARIDAADEAIVRDQIAVAQIPAPTGAEGRRADWIEARFRAAGLDDVHRDAAGNVIGRRPGATNDAPVAVCAHLDTVFGADVDVSVHRSGMMLTGPGITDNGRGLAALVALVRELDGDRIRTQRPIDFVATTGEEGAGDLRGARHYFGDRGAFAAAAIAIDGAGDERVIHRALGSRRFRVTVTGPGGHSWAAFGAPNAVHAIAGAATQLAALALPVNPRTTLGVGRIGGGISVNAIPADAWMEIDLRSPSSATIESFTKTIERVCERAVARENDRRSRDAASLAMTIERIGDRPGGETPAHDPLVTAAAEITTMIDRRTELALASTDANVAIARGIPAIAIGAGGRGGDAHTSTEWFDNARGAVGVGRALAIVASAAGLIVD